MNDWHNKVVWITGATSGIGRELAGQFAALGAVLIVSARREPELNALAASLPGGAERHHVVALDLAEPDRVLAIATKAMESLPAVDVLINNGGISQRCLFLEADLDVYQRLVTVNYLGTVALTKAVVPAMVARAAGSVVAISSVAGLMGSKLRTGYSGSKFAVVGFMECLRAELAEKGIHCMTVCPGFVQTNIAVNALDGAGQAQGHNEPAIEGGMPVDECCQQIIRSIGQRRDEVVIGRGLSGWGPSIKRFFPGLYRRIAASAEFR